MRVLKNDIYNLCGKGEKVIDSENFRGLYYLIKDGHVVIMTEKNGELCLKLKNVAKFCKELKEIQSVWGDIKTNKCLMHGTRDKKQDERKIMNDTK